MVGGAVAALFCVTVAGGYGLGWSWTGFSGNDTVWDWLGLLLLPVVIALLPLWYRTHRRFGIEWWIGGSIVAAVWAVTLIGGYLLDWTWTGYDGKALWDWLELLVLPAVLAVLPILLTEGRADRRWKIAFGVLAVCFAVCVLGGYLLHWSWTGFEGNTLWDWLHLFLVPFVLPAALIWLAARDRA
jgi:uncharacterized membrane protein